MFQMNFELNENEKNEYVEEEKIWIMKMNIYIYWKWKNKDNEHEIAREIKASGISKSDMARMAPWVGIY